MPPSTTRALPQQADQSPLPEAPLVERDVRRQRPPVPVVALIYAIVNGEQFSSYYIFYGSLLFAVAYVATFRYLYEEVSGALLRAAGYSRRAVLVGTGPHIEAVAHALEAGPHHPINVIGFVSLTPRPDNGLVALGSLEAIGAIVREHRADEVS